MLTKKQCLFAIILAIFSCNFSVAQKAPAKFGKISMDEMKMTVYDKDTSASAVELINYGVAEILYTTDNFELIFTQHVRIKILKKEGLENANIDIQLYSPPGGSADDFTNLKALTYNLEGDKIVESKLEKKDVFTEVESKYWKLKKFAFPDVKVGSVIEYTYTIKSEYYYNFRTWYFQSDIPCVWNEFRTRIPDFYDFKRVFGGYLNPSISESTTSSGSILGTSITYVINGDRWVFQDVPGFKNEKYITTAKDYLAKVEFEINTVQFPRQMMKTFTTTWKEIVNKLIASEYFGLAINRKGIVKELSEQINPSDSPDKKILTAYLLIKKHMKWNERYGVELEGSLREAFNKNEGNTAEINLLLVNLLRSVDINAHPVLISTRNHGRINTFYPRLSAFNSVLAMAVIDGKQILMDATKAYLLPGELPFNCLNSKGLIAIEDNPQWIDLLSEEQRYYSSVIMAKIEDDKFSAEIGKSYKSLTAASLRYDIAKDGKEKYIENFKKENPEWEINEYSIENERDITQSLSERIKVENFSNIDVSSDMIYIPAILAANKEENPFSSETREYPVDFGAPIFEKHFLNITIPNGYKVEELPQPTKLVLPDKSASFTYSIQTVGDKIQVMSQIKIDKTMYLPQEYHLLKELYRNIISKYGEQIVLKRIEE